MTKLATVIPSKGSIRTEQPLHFFLQHTPLKILVYFESGVHVFSGVLCRNAWNSAIHLFIIWFTDILASLDIHVQTELQGCLYEYGFNSRRLCIILADNP